MKTNYLREAKRPVLLKERARHLHGRGGLSMLREHLGRVDLGEPFLGRIAQHFEPFRTKLLNVRGPVVHLPGG